MAGKTDNQGSRDLIAVVDDDESFRIAIHGLLRSMGLKVRAFSSAEEFLHSGQSSQTACLITDIQMPGMSGIELQAKLAAEQHRIAVIFITAYGNPRLRDQARKLGAVQFLDKPFDDKVLLETIRDATASRV